MLPETPVAPTPPAMAWTGRVLSGLVVLALLGSAAVKLMKPAMFVKQWGEFGYPDDLALPIAITEIVCALIYAIPQTSVLGAILLTGYLGGAVATHVRVGDAFIPPVVMGVLAWLGLYLRCSRVRALLPLRL
jgi:hypothetical protein